MLREAWQKGLNAPYTTAVGRLFDAASALTGITTHASFEGQGPMYLEALCDEAAEPLRLPLAKGPSTLWETDWEPLLKVLQDKALSPARRSAVFHASLAQALLEQALRVREEHGITRVGLSGGVFQNRVLTEQSTDLLTHHGFEVDIPERLPVNDAAISFGQVVEYAAGAGASGE